MNVTLQVAISDLNDYAPQFERSQYIVQVSEDHRPNTIVQPELPAVVDLDSPRNRVTDAFLEPSGDNDASFPFELDQSRVVLDGVSLLERLFLRLKPGVQLDREKQADFRAVLRVRDGQPEDLTYNTATTLLTVYVRDVNDNEPSVRSSYNVTVREDLPSGSRILQVDALDADDDRNALLHFAVPVSDRPRIAQQFELNSLTGEIFNKRPFNFEVRSHYQFSVVVSDSGIPSRSATTSISINIIGTCTVRFT